MTVFSTTMSVDSIVGADFVEATPDNIATMFLAAATRETSAAYGKAFVVWSAINVKGLKAADLIPLLGVGKSQISNYVRQIDMVREMGLEGKHIVAAWVDLTGSRGWFAKRSTPEYAALVADVNAAESQDDRVALICGTPLPESERKALTITDAIAMLTAARDLLLTLDVSESDATIVSTLTGECDAAAAAPAKVLVAA